MSKYGNKKVEIDGYKFDSIKESEKYLELKFLKQHKQIKDFEVHPSFVIFDGYVNKQGQKIRPIIYTADFRVVELDNSEEILDIKPYIRSKQKYFLTAVFKLKVKLFEARYPHLTLAIE